MDIKDELAKLCLELGGYDPNPSMSHPLFWFPEHRDEVRRMRLVALRGGVVKIVWSFDEVQVLSYAEAYLLLKGLKEKDDA